MKAGKRGRSTALYETILKLKDLDECCRFFEDLCTPTELRSMEQRFDVAVYLQQGLVYLDILEKTGASSATISRVRRAMLDNGAGGVMQEVIRREAPRTSRLTARVRSCSHLWRALANGAREVAST